MRKLHVILVNTRGVDKLLTGLPIYAEGLDNTVDGHQVTVLTVGDMALKGRYNFPFLPGQLDSGAEIY